MLTADYLKKIPFKVPGSFVSTEGAGNVLHDSG